MSIQSEDINIMIQIKQRLESSVQMQEEHNSECNWKDIDWLVLDVSPFLMGNENNNSNENNSELSQNSSREIDYKIILTLVNKYLHKYCNHKYITDTIDIDLDRSKTIKYCEYCYLEDKI